MRYDIQLLRCCFTRSVKLANLTVCASVLQARPLARTLRLSARLNHRTVRRRGEVRSERSVHSNWSCSWCSASRRRHRFFLRKEVIQPHLPVQLPCYDFVPVTRPAFGGCVLAVRSPTSGMTSSHDVTGGVYKARERIHRTMADARLLATPPSWGRVAAPNPN